MVKRNLRLMIGLPGSGKSTTVDKFIEQYADAPETLQVLSPDYHIYNEDGDYEFTGERLANAWATVKEQFNTAIYETEDHILIDATFICKEWRKEFVELAKLKGLEVRAHFVNTDLELCLLRNSWRLLGRRVPDDTIKRHHSMLEPPSTKDGEFDHVTIHTTPPNANEHAMIAYRNASQVTMKKQAKKIEDLENEMNNALGLLWECKDSIGLKKANVLDGFIIKGIENFYKKIKGKFGLEGN